MADADTDGQDTASETLIRHVAPAFAGMWRFMRGRIGRPSPPHRDPSKVMIIFQPHYRVVAWEGPESGHIVSACIPLRCETDTKGNGHHNEARPDGFTWEGARFHGLHAALENQAFRQWYETGGKETVEREEMVLRPDQYARGAKPPLPAFNFFLHEHIMQMSSREIAEYRRVGTIPKRLRRRGRNKRSSSALEE